MTKTILIVDDRQAVLTTLEMILEDEGYNIITATSPKDALAKLDATPKPKVNLLVTDYDMGEENGIELIQSLRRRGVAIPTILFSGQADELEGPLAAVSGDNTLFNKGKLSSGRPLIELVEKKLSQSAHLG